MKLSLTVAEVKQIMKKYLCEQQRIEADESEVNAEFVYTTGVLKDSDYAMSFTFLVDEDEL